MSYSKFFGRALVALTLATVISYGSPRTEAATESADIFATVVEPLTLTKVDDLDFGTFTVDDVTAGTVVMAPNDSRSATGGVTLVLADVGQAAEFDVAGDPNRAFTVTLPPNSTIELSGPGANMPVDDFMHDSGEMTDGSGNDTFHVGATLSVAGGQTPGSYSGSFDVTVEYN